MTEITGMWFDEWLEGLVSLAPEPVRFDEKVYPVLFGKTHVAQCLDAYRVGMQRIVDDLVMSGAEWNDAAIRSRYPFEPIAGDVVDGSWSAAYEAPHQSDLSHVLSLILGLRGLAFSFDVAAPL